METQLDLTSTWLWISSLIIFVVWYYFIATEEKYHINKAKPAMFIWTLLFMLIWTYYLINGLKFDSLTTELSHLILEIAELYFFLFVAMTFIETLVERRVFELLKYKLVSRGWSYKRLFWWIWFMAFFLSPIADNLTTALTLSTVLLTIDKKNKDFIVPSAINIVVAANAWWAWSPFGDITTLMAWTANKWKFVDFLALFPAAIVWWLVTWFILSYFVPKWKPKFDIEKEKKPKMKYGWMVIVYIGVFTIFSAVLSHQLFAFPAMWWMLFGLSILKLYGYVIERKKKKTKFDVYASMRFIENDTLLFFFGILAAVWALHHIWFLHYIVNLYDIIHPTSWNIAIWFISAIVDNVPVMSAILKANPEMGMDQWLLVTLTAWIGWSLISFGSAAWVWVMWKLRGIYTFSSHMKYFWVVLVGYIVSLMIRYFQFEILGIY